MYKFVILVISAGFAWSMEDKNIVDGSWRVLSITKCENCEEFPIQIDITRRKCDRTTDCFDAELDLKEPIDESFSICCHPCKHVDGGCKPYQDVYDPNLVNFVKKFADNNIKTAFEMMNHNPPDFPLFEGKYTLKNFTINYCELPKSGPEGTFSADCYISKLNEDRACIHLDVIFKEELDNCD